MSQGTPGEPNGARDDKAESRVNREVSSSTLDRLVDLVNDLVWLLSGDGERLIYMNAAARSVYGAAADALRTRPHLWCGAIHPHDKPGILDQLQRITDLTSFAHRFRALNASGVEVWLDAHFQFLPGNHEQAPLIGVVAKDITRRIRTERELDEAHAIYETLVQNVPIKVFRKDESGRLTFCNQLYCEALGQSLEELIGKTDYDLFPKSLADKYVADDARVLSTGLPMHDIEQHPGPDGGISYVEVLKSPIVDARGRRSGIQGMFWDVTSRVMAEQEMQHSRDIAQAASKAKGDFLANVSHEIRTPMNAIIGITELLMEGCRDKQQREYLAMIQQSGENLLTLLNDILDFSKIEAGKLELESVPFDIRERLSDTLRSLAIRAHSKDLEMVFDVDPGVPQILVADVNRIRQVLANLVSNAIKFTAAGEVIVRLGCPRCRPGRAHLTFDVIDSGIGIPPHRLESIFHEFEQADSSTARQYGGTGLGLPITRQLVNLMGGQLQVTSQVGIGSQFHFELELPYVEQSAALPDELGAGLAGLRVLVLENHLAAARALARLLDAWQVQSEFATTAEQAQQVLLHGIRRGQPFDVALIDASLEGNSGPALARWVRKQDGLGGLRMILLTSGQPFDRLTRSLDMDRIIKPIKPSDLLEALAAALGVDTTEHEPASAPAGRVRSLHVLVAEDHEINQRLTVALLEKLGHRVAVVGQGDAAVEAYRRGRYDLILMDVQMPIMDGLQATQEIRKLEKPDVRTPILALSAHVTEEFRQLCLTAGMDDYLTKPIRREKLTAAIEQWTGTRTAIQSADIEASSNRKVDWQHAFETVAGDRDLLQELIQVFLRDREQMSAEIDRAVASQDWRLLRRSSHSMRGALSHLGARTAAELASQLEHAAQTEQSEGIGELAARFQNELRELTVELERFTTS